MQSPANHQLVRDYNRWQLLDKIRRTGGISRVDLARSLSLSNTAVSKITAQLLDQGLILETGVAEQSRGRRPLLLEINATAGYILGFDLALIHALHGAIADLTGRLVRVGHVPLPDRRPAAVAAAIAGMSRRLCQEAGAAPGRVLGLGVSAPGVVDYEAGVVVRSVNLDWKNVPFRQLLEARVPWPVTVDWTCNALALAEWRHHGTGVRAMGHVVVGMGIAAALMFDGSIFRGVPFSAGEFGHTVIMADGPRCRCGNRGCIEAICSHGAIVDAAGGSLPIAGVIHAALGGNRAAAGVIRRAGHYFGIGLANLVNLLNIQRVVVQFDCPELADLYLPPARATLMARALPHLAEHVEVVPSRTGCQGVLMGTVQVVLQQLFRSPTEPPRASSVITPVWQY